MRYLPRSVDKIRLQPLIIIKAPPKHRHLKPLTSVAKESTPEERAKLKQFMDFEKKLESAPYYERRLLGKMNKNDILQHMQASKDSQLKKGQNSHQLRQFRTYQPKVEPAPVMDATFNFFSQLHDNKKLFPKNKEKRWGKRLKQIGKDRSELALWRSPESEKKTFMPLKLLQNP